MEPFVHGDYPQSMRDLVNERLPTFSAEEKSLVEGNLGFLGVNYYTSYYAKHKPPPPNEKLRYSFDSWAEQISKLPCSSLAIMNRKKFIKLTLSIGRFNV